MRLFESQKTVSRAHKWLGLGLTVPLLCWIASSQILHYVGLTAPNGLQGVYRLQPFNSEDVDLTDSRIAPNQILARLKDQEGLERIHWIRLQAVHNRLLYVVKPTPFSLEMTFDAISGERLDPLNKDLLLAIAAQKLERTTPRGATYEFDFNRDYEVGRVPAVRVRMDGDQPSELILARHSGRTLRRFDSDASRFTWWYRNFHVFQWGGMIWVFTLILFAVGVLAIVQTALGGWLWWRRRHARRNVQLTSRHRALRWHRLLGLTVATFLITQVLVGAYMWLNLGPFEGLFRGKNTFAEDWVGGIKATEQLAVPREVLSHALGTLPHSPRPVQVIEWRNMLGKNVWLVSPRRDQLPVVFMAETGQSRDRLTAEEAGQIASGLFKGTPSASLVNETEYYWNDLNRPIPAYKMRMSDTFSTDAFVCATTGEVISRRTSLWRAFGPFLRYHSFGWTGQPAIDFGLLIAFQLTLLGTIVSGLNLHRMLFFRRS